MPSTAQSSLRTRLRIFYIVLGLTALGGAAALARQIERGAARLPPLVDLGLSPEELGRVDGISIGEPGAPVVIREFADFQCPACSLYARSLTPAIAERYVRTGMVRYVHYDFPLTAIHPQALPAAVAARCAHEQGRFWDYHDLLYKEQEKWSATNVPDGHFVEYARSLGLHQDSFRICLSSDRFREAIEEHVRFGKTLGVRGTPTLLVNGKRLPETLGIRIIESLIQREVEGRD